jgi:elongation factor G
VAKGVVPTERIRNVLVVGHTGTGKSSLVEGMLRIAGHPAHGEGCPTVDHEPEEKERGSSLSLALASFDYKGTKFNVLDTPGGAEVLGDVYPALLAADIAIFVVDAAVGVQPQQEELWRVCERRGLPRMVYLNKLDLERARYQDVIDELRHKYGTPLAPVAIPLHLQPEFDGLIDLLHDDAIKLVGDERIRGPVPEDRRVAADRNRTKLVEAIVENDDELLMRYLDGEVPSVEELAPLFAHGIAECGFFPVICGSAERTIGVKLTLDFLVEEGPSPAEAVHPLPHDGPTVAYVLKTFSDQYVGRINLLRILSGSLATDDELVVERTGTKQRLHQLFSLRGREQLPVGGAAAGDLVAVAKLDDVVTGDVLTANGTEVELDVPEAPMGFHRVILHAPTVADDDKLATALPRILAEDPAIRIVDEGGHGGRLLAFQGPNHVDVTLARLKRKHGVNAEVKPAPVPYLETIRRPSDGLGRHVKQSGGHGQYGIARIEMRPQARGEGFVFENAIVGGVIPNQLIPSVEKGVREAMKEGPLGRFPVVDVAVKLVDGKHHSVDSSDAAFQMAGILAFRDAAAKAEPVLLEPILAVELTVPEDLTGAVMSDLSSRRGRILGTDHAGKGRTRVDAQVPQAELATFAAEFRALTSGRGEVTMDYDHHEEVPEQIARRALERLADEED